MIDSTILNRFTKPRFPWLSFLNIAKLLLLSLIVFTSAAWLFNFLRNFSDPSGANGYFYLKQTESLTQDGVFYFKDRSLVFGLLVLSLKIFNNSLLSYQFVIVSVWGLLVLAVGLLTQNLTHKMKPVDQFVVLILALLATVSSTQLYEFSITFLKNAFAVTLVLYSLVFLTSGLKMKPRVLGAGFFLLLALLTHKSVLFVAMCFALPWGMKNANRKQRIYFVLGLFLVTVMFLMHFENSRAYLWAILNSINHYSGWLLWAKSLARNNIEMLLSMVAILIILITAIYKKSFFDEKERFYLYGVGLFTILSIQPFQAAGTESAGYRMILFAPVMVIPLAAMSLNQYTYKKIIALGIMSLYFCQPFLSTKHLDDAFTSWSFYTEDVLKIKEFVNPEDHLTSHHGLEFFIDYTTGIRSRSFLSDYPEKKDYRIAFVAERWLKNPQAQQSLRSKALLEIGLEYILISEKEWQKLVMEFSIPNHWKNPHTHRPSFIYE